MRYIKRYTDEERNEMFLKRKLDLGLRDRSRCLYILKDLDEQAEYLERRSKFLRIMKHPFRLRLLRSERIIGEYQVKLDVEEKFLDASKLRNAIELLERELMEMKND